MTEDTIYFSFRDKTGEAQHATIEAADAGKYIGDLRTKLEAYEAILERWIVESGRKSGSPNEKVSYPEGESASRRG